MKLFLGFLLVFCVILTGCSASQPSAERMQAAVDKFIKKDNPAAQAPIVEFTPAEVYIAADFQFTDFSYTDKQGAKQIIRSGKGRADFILKDGKWIFQEVVIDKQTFPVNEELK